MTAFADTVKNVVGAIPAGSVATYGDIARMAGNPGASRAVGAVMRTNKDTKAVPCHRVVGHDGSLTGYAYGTGIPTKKKKLAAEGVAFRGNKVDLARSRWNATQEK